MRMPHSRRSFLGAVSAAASAVGLGGRGASASVDEPLAVLGGKPVRRGRFSAWPIIAENDEKSWMEVLRKKKWCRIDGDYANRFEESWARIMGAKHCVAVANGTSALITSLAALGIGPGDEVLVPPYTFVATINAVLVHHALPVFVNTDPETFQVDPRLLESSITEHTACILPVHIGGSAADMDSILAVAARHKLPVAGGRLPGRAGGMEGPEAQHARRPGLLQLPGLQEPHLGRRRRHPDQRRSPGGGMPELPEQRAGHRRRSQLRPQRRESPHDRVRRPRSC